LGKPIDVPRHFGFITTWKLVGPFENTGEKGFPVAYPPEQSLDYNAKYAGKTAKVRWFDHETADEYGEVDVNKAVGPFKGAIVYAAAEFTSDKAQMVEFRLGCETAWKLWLNGALLFSRTEQHFGSSVDQYRVQAELRPGMNVILLKLAQNEQKEPWAQGWSFQMRVCDSTGGAVLSTTRPPSKATFGKPEKAAGGDQKPKGAK
jgi:hypothetical protein